VFDFETLFELGGREVVKYEQKDGVLHRRATVQKQKSSDAAEEQPSECTARPTVSFSAMKKEIFTRSDPFALPYEPKQGVTLSCPKKHTNFLAVDNVNQRRRKRNRQPMLRLNVQNLTKRTLYNMVFSTFF
jgi:hypothetical protein